MKKRYLTAVALLGLGICIVLAVLALLPPRPGVTKANFDRIQIGMTEAEVDAVFGRPVENVRRRKFHHFVCWEIPDGEGAIVYFDGNGRTTETVWMDVDFDVFQRLRRLLPF